METGLWVIAAILGLPTIFWVGLLTFVGCADVADYVHNKYRKWRRGK